jgi:TPP-dependent pyruvate/acetoin dehydrogenase alpha subunit
MVSDEALKTNLEMLRLLYYGMLRIRMVEERIAKEYQNQEMRCPVHLSTGQEATAVGACAALSKGDYVFSAHRAHAHYLAAGGNLRAMLAELYGRVTGCCQGKGGSMHLVDLSAGFLGAVPIVGSTIPIAVGAAMGSLMRNESRVTMSFLGEAATEEGVFHEAMNLAALKNLPIVFICENNLYSVYSPLSVRQPEARSVCALAAAHGIESQQADGNNVAEVYGLVKKAVDRARSGRGAAFLELMTYRWREHCGPNYDNDLGYRTEKEFLQWKGRDPLETFQQWLLTESLVSRSEIKEMTGCLELEIQDALSFAKNSPYPTESSLFQHIFAE